MLRAAQIRAARALLVWRQEDMAEAAKGGLTTIVRIEPGEGMVQGNFSIIMKIQRASSEKEYSLPRIRTGNWRETGEEAPARLVCFCETKPKLAAEYR
jgi:DNA-binding XRE family transcriptional regulator